MATIKTKNGKAIGVDQIPNEVLKSDKIMNALKEFYQFYFETQIFPIM
jgi:hypothetical protein